MGGPPSRSSFSILPLPVLDSLQSQNCPVKGVMLEGNPGSWPWSTRPLELQVPDLDNYMDQKTQARGRESGF